MTTKEQIQSEAAMRRKKLQEQLEAGMKKEKGGISQGAFSAAIRAVDEWEGQQYIELHQSTSG